MLGLNTLPRGTRTRQGRHARPLHAARGWVKMRGRESQARTTAWSSTRPHTHTPPHQQIHLILPHGLPGRSRGQGQGAYAVETHAAPAKETAMRGGEVATHVSVRSSLSHPSPWSPPGAGVFARQSPIGLLTRVAPGTIARATGCACVRLLNSSRISGSVHTACWIVTKPRKERKTEHPHRVRLSSKPKEIGKETSTGTPPALEASTRITVASELSSFPLSW